MATTLRLTDETELKVKKAKLAIKALIASGVVSRAEITEKICQHCTEAVVNEAIQGLITEGLISESPTVGVGGDIR